MNFRGKGAWVVLLFLAACVSSVEAACQVAADPESLVLSIAEAGQRSRISSEELRQMMPCPGAKVRAAALVLLLNAHFTKDQIELLEAAITFAAPTLPDMVAMAHASASLEIEEQALASYPTLAITLEELLRFPRGELTGGQIRGIADHVALELSESDFLEAMRIAPNDSRALLFRGSLKERVLASKAAVIAFFRYPNRLELAERVYVSDPLLWIDALKNQTPVRELSKFAWCNSRKMIDIFQILANAGIPESAAGEFVAANTEEVSIEARDVEFLSTSSLSPLQVETIFEFSQHETLHVDAGVVARLKSLGVGDGAILAFGRDGVHAITREVTPPRCIRKVEPEYSEEARKACAQGTVVLSMVVDSGGAACNIRVVRSLGAGLDEKAIHSVRLWRFEPGTKDGQAVATPAKVEVNFRIDCDRTGGSAAKSNTARLRRKAPVGF